MEQPDRVIFHCDCNSFYCSVELLDHPELRQVPTAVCGDPEGRHGIILAKNEAAKKYGVKTAETIWQAKRKCPQLQLLPPHWEKYRYFYTVINGIYGRYTDLVEPFSIDESWLDVTGSWRLFQSSPRALADLIRHQVYQETGLTISVGVSWNKVFAKLGSDYQKPDATTVFSRENYREKLWSLPVTDMIFVGRSAADALRKIGVLTIGDLANADPGQLQRLLGKSGPELRQAARGEDTAPVRRFDDREAPKSVGRGRTFPRDLTSFGEIRAAITALADDVAGRLRRAGMWANGVQLTIKDPSLHVIQRQKQLMYSTHISTDLSQACLDLLQQHWRDGKPVRMLTVTAVNLSPQPFAVQESLFEEAPRMDPKKEKLETSMDAIRRRFGPGAIARASTIAPEIGLHGLSSLQEDDPDEE
ncbi:MAG: DNA polymerase IV [Candidatus Heritagella sp.]